MFRIVPILFVLIAALAGQLRADMLLLIDEQSVHTVVIAPSQTHADEELAIDELNRHLLAMSGREVPVIRVALQDLAAEIDNALSKQQVPIVIGQLDDALRASIQAEGSDSASFAIVAKDNLVRIAGLSPQGTLFGVYELLEQLGCRWFTPGDFGTVIPKSPTVAIRAQHTVQVPSFEGRALQMTETHQDWYRRLRLGGKPVPGAHGIDIGDANIETNPELFAIVGGERLNAQLCITHPDVLRRAVEQARIQLSEDPDSQIIGMGPGDGRGFCECDNCRALDAADWDPFAKMISVTDRYVWFFNKVLEELSHDHPNSKITFYAYDGTMRPPAKIKPNRRIIPTFALIRLCHLHGMANPVCPERDYYQTLLVQWSKLVDQSFDRDYLLNYTGFPISHVHRSRSEIPLLKEYGITRIRRQTWPCWGNMTPGIYITAKLLWNADADVDALEQDFYDTFFGPASAPMGRYFERLEALHYNADTHPRWENAEMARIFSTDALNACRSDLDQAASLATDETFARRVSAFRLMHESLEVYLATIDAQDRVQFAAARDGASRLIDLQTQAMQHNPPLLYEFTATNLQKSIEHAYARVSDNNELLVGIPNTWEFLMDPENVGEDLKYWSRDLRGGNWDTRTLSSIDLKAIVGDWDRELCWYSGDGWYRTRIVLPETDITRKRVFLWFRRMPDGSKIWVNGQLIGQCDGTSGKLTPYELDVTDVIVTNVENAIAVKATGPLHGPVMLYTTAGPATPSPEVAP